MPLRQKNRPKVPDKIGYAPKATWERIVAICNPPLSNVSQEPHGLFFSAALEIKPETARKFRASIVETSPAELDKLRPAW
jgi:hypothetical protein